MSTETTPDAKTELCDEKTFLVKMTKSELCEYSRLLIQDFTRTLHKLHSDFRSTDFWNVKEMDDTLMKIKTHLSTLPKIELVGGDRCEFELDEHSLKATLILE